MNKSTKRRTHSTVSAQTSIFIHYLTLLFVVGLQNQFDGEVQTRIEREKDIMQEVDNSKYNLHKKIDNERTDKALKLGAFKDDTNSQLKKQHKYIEEF